MPERERLVAWLHDEPVAVLERGKRDSIRLYYTDQVLATRSYNSPVLSCSLLVDDRVKDAKEFIDGLLPEGEPRRHLAERARIPSHDSYGLIGRYGRDVAGAVQFLPEGEHPVSDAHWSIEHLDDHTLDQIVDDLSTNPLAIVDESELSLPGLQAKTLLVRLDDGQWGRPLGGQPSTHILKRDSASHHGIVAAECEALALARHVGLTSMDAWLERHGDWECLVVERFDRIIDSVGRVVHRVHQED